MRKDSWKHLKNDSEPRHWRELASICGEWSMQMKGRQAKKTKANKGVISQYSNDLLFIIRESESVSFEAHQRTEGLLFHMHSGWITAVSSCYVTGKIISSDHSTYQDSLTGRLLWGFY